MTTTAAGGVAGAWPTHPPTTTGGRETGDVISTTTVPVTAAEEIVNGTCSVTCGATLREEAANENRQNVYV